ncbi:MAG: hypothetical protein Q8N23_11510 [Archangium sp.]|nr:hypothetical protein [Archangium sp.]MDP3569617.1 hypothetical protein [Archangium sp.]
MKTLILLTILSVTAACGAPGGSGTGGGSGSTGGGTGSMGGGTGSMGGGAGNMGGGAGAMGWREIAPPDPFSSSSNYVYGVYCTAADKCVVAAGTGSSRGGGVYALGASAWGELLVDGDYEDGPLSGISGSLGDFGFLGFVPSRTGVVARVTSSGVIVSATGDITTKANWTAVKTGTVTGGNFGLNATLTLQSAADNDWVFVNNNGYVYSATQAPSASTTWTRLWAPTSNPPVPADFVAQYTADKTLCDWDISTTAQPFPSQSFWAAQDLSVLIHPAYGLNQNSWREINNKETEFGAVKAGVCISTDKGLHFYFKELPENLQVSSPGPFGVTCLDKDTCFAFNGTQSQANSYIYASTNASMGKTSTWTKATLPSGFATSTDIQIAALFFAPDKTHGWAVGNNNRKPLLLRTTDAGRTWVDISGQVAALADSDLVNGFALDKDRIWVVGRYGFVGTTGSAQN